MPSIWSVRTNKQFTFKYLPCSYKSSPSFVGNIHLVLGRHWCLHGSLATLILWDLFQVFGVTSRILAQRNHFASLFDPTGVDFVRWVERRKFGVDIHLQLLLRWRTMSLAGTVDLRAAANGTVGAAAGGRTSGIATLHDGLVKLLREKEKSGGINAEV